MKKINLNTSNPQRSGKSKTTIGKRLKTVSKTVKQDHRKKDKNGLPIAGNTRRFLL